MFNIQWVSELLWLEHFKTRALKVTTFDLTSMPRLDMQIINRATDEINGITFTYKDNWDRLNTNVPKNIFFCLLQAEMLLHVCACVQCTCIIECI